MKNHNIEEKEEIFELTPEMLESLKESEKEIKAGNLIPHQKVMKEFDGWLKQ